MRSDAEIRNWIAMQDRAMRVKFITDNEEMQERINLENRQKYGLWKQLTPSPYDHVIITCLLITRNMAKRTNPYDWPRPGPTKNARFIGPVLPPNYELARRQGFAVVPRTTGGQTGGEMKYFDTRLALSAIPSVAAWTGTEFDPATLNTLFCPTVGAAINQRIGREVKVLKIKINGQIRCANQTTQADTDLPTSIRLALVQDMQTNTAQMQGEQVFTNTTTADEAVLTFQNIDNFGRFRVLKDKMMAISNPAISWDGTNVFQSGFIRPFKWSIKFQKPVSVRFNATNGGTVADIIDNSFHVVANCSSTELAPQISYLCRVCYKE